MSGNQSWGGRFSTPPSRLMSDFSDSQHYDRKLYSHDIKASIAHARMLAEQGIISDAEADLIEKGLLQVKNEIETGKFIWKSELEDVHMNIEGRLTEIIGVPGKKLHTGRSRNDQTGLTFRMYVSDKLKDWMENCSQLCKTLWSISEKNTAAILPGFTHLQPAQPVSLAQHLLAYAGMFKRDIERINETLARVRISPLGAAALAGSTYPLNPDSVRKKAGFNSVYANSMDAVSDRDYVLESQFIACCIMMHLSRLCEEIILWSTPSFNFITLPDEFSTGSSIMPQKKNPDAAELARGKCGRVYGNLMAILTVMKGLPLTYNRDLQEDKEGFFDTDATVISSLQIICALLQKLVFNKDKMFAACKNGFLNATELADYLAGKGVPFREAHHMAGKAVALAEERKSTLENLDINDFKSISSLIEEDVYKVLDYENCVKRRETPGGTGPESVKKQLDDYAKWLQTL